jgi:zinc protease
MTTCGMRVAVCVLIVSGLAAVATAAEPISGVASPADPRYTSIRPLAENVTYATLDNGLTVIVQENHVAPVATVRCFVRNTGSAYEGRWLGAGLSHVLEHVVAGGSTSHRTEEQITKAIGRFGGATNAFTSTDMTVFFIDCPAKDTMSAIELLADNMQHVIFEPKEFARELTVVRRELADGEVDRGRVMGKLLSRTLYTTSPVRHPVIGYLEVLNRTTNQTIIDFYHERYVPNNQIFVVVGDVKTQDVLDRVARQWRGTPRGVATYMPLPDEPPQLSPREASTEMEGATFDFTLAWPTVKLADRDLYALDLAAYILGEGESSRLVRHLKHDRGLVLSIGASSETPHFVHGYFAVSASARPETWQKAADEIVAEVDRLRDRLVSPEELARAKKQKATELVFQRQTVQQAADSLGQSEIAAADPLFDAAYVENIQRVTAEEIRDAARRWFVPQRLNRVVIAPLGGLPKTARDHTAAKSRELVSVRLPNGLRVLIKRHANLPLVNIQAFTLCGALADDPATAGRAALVAEMLDKGTAAHSAEQIAHYFDSVGGVLSFNASYTMISGSATTLGDDFPAAAALLAECFTQSTFPNEEFAKAKDVTLGEITERAGDPEAEIFEAYCDALPATSPFHLVLGGKTETVKRLTAGELRRYHARYFVPNNMLVTVFGDIDPDRALELVKKHFGTLPADPHFKPLDFARSNRVAEPIVRHKVTSKPTGMIVLGYPCPGIFAKEEHAAVTVLGAVLAGYDYPGGWLYKELRGEGLVYDVHAMAMTGAVPGYFTIFAQTRPDKVDEVVGRIEANLRRARQGHISEEEVRRAVELIVALHAQENTTIAAQAQQAARDTLYGLGPEYDRTFAKRIESVTRDDVLAAARKYFDGNKVLVTSSPK